MFVFEDFENGALGTEISVTGPVFDERVIGERLNVQIGKLLCKIEVIASDRVRIVGNCQHKETVFVHHRTECRECGELL
jgi:hypothetical protein